MTRKIYLGETLTVVQCYRCADGFCLFGYGSIIARRRKDVKQRVAGAAANCLEEATSLSWLSRVNFTRIGTRAVRISRALPPAAFCACSACGKLPLARGENLWYNILNWASALPRRRNDISTSPSAREVRISKYPLRWRRFLCYNIMMNATTKRIQCIFNEVMHKWKNI